MTIENWVKELNEQLRNFDSVTWNSEVKMADITLGYLDKDGLIHYHTVKYRAKDNPRGNVADLAG